MAREGWRAAPPVIEQNWDRIITSDPAALLDAIKALPGEALIETPSLLIAANYLQHIVVGADPRLFHRNVTMVADYRSGPEGLRERLISLTARSSEARTSGRVAEAFKIAVKARRFLDAARPEDVAQLRTALPHLTLQWARSLDQADSALAFYEYETSYELALITGQAESARRAAGSLAWMHADRGSARAAELWLGRARASGSTNDRYDAAQHLAAALLAVYRLEAGEVAAQVAATESVSIGEYWAADLWLRSLQVHSAHEAAVLFHRVEHEIARHPGGLSTVGSNARYLTFTRARLALVLRSPLPTYDVAEFDEPTRNEFSAIVAYRRGDFRAAIQTGAGTINGVRGATPRQCSTLLLIWAASRLRLGRRDAAMDAFACAGAIIGDEEIPGLYALLRLDDLRELSSMTAHPLSEELLRRLALGSVAVEAVLPILTAREKQILALLAGSASSADMATELFVSANTVKSLQRRLYRKLNVHSRAEAAEFAHRLGINEP